MDEFLNALKKCKDCLEYHKQGGFYYRAGSFGMTKHKADRHLTRVGYCADFRNKTNTAILAELKQPIN